MNIKAVLNKKRVADDYEIYSPSGVIRTDEAYELLDGLNDGEYRQVELLLFHKRVKADACSSVEVTRGAADGSFVFKYRFNSGKTKTEVYNKNMSAIMMYKTSEKGVDCMVRLLY